MIIWSQDITLHPSLKVEVVNVGSRCSSKKYFAFEVSRYTLDPCDFPD